MKETNVSCMKYRKSTHIAGADVESIIYEKGKCIVTIKEAYYSKTEVINGKKVGTIVNGKVLDGYFIEWVEDLKPFMVNSGNRKIIASLVKEAKKITSVESKIVANWAGVKIELYFDEKVTFGDEITGGIKVRPQSVVIEKKPLSEANFVKALESIKNGTYSVESLKNDFKLTTEQLARL